MAAEKNKGGRPRKEYKVARSGDNIQVEDAAGYAGSISLRKLCLYLRQLRGKNTDQVSAQSSAEQSGTRNGDYNTTGKSDLVVPLQ